MTFTAIFGCKLYGKEPPDIVGLEEHESYDRASFVDFEWMTGQNNAFG